MNADCGALAAPAKGAVHWDAGGVPKRVIFETIADNCSPPDSIHRNSSLTFYSMADNCLPWTPALEIFLVISLTIAASPPEAKRYASLPPTASLFLPGRARE